MAETTSSAGVVVAVRPVVAGWAERDETALRAMGVLLRLPQGWWSSPDDLTVDAVVAKAYQYADAIMAMRADERHSSCRMTRCLCLCFHSASEPHDPPKERV